MDAYFEDLEKIGNLAKEIYWICTVLYSFPRRGIKYCVKEIYSWNYVGTYGEGSGKKDISIMTGM